MFERFNVEAFIDAVKKRPALYQTTHSQNNKKDKRSHLWHEIGPIIYPQWENYDVLEKTDKVILMQKRWRSLKDSFTREIRNQRDPKKSRKKYEHYDKLTFLLPVRATKVKIKTETPEPEMTGNQTTPKTEDETDDSDRLFLLSFVNDLRRLPFATKYWVRMMFSQIMHRAARNLDGCDVGYGDDVGSPENGCLDGCPPAAGGFHVCPD